MLLNQHEVPSAIPLHSGCCTKALSRVSAASWQIAHVLIEEKAIKWLNLITSRASWIKDTESRNVEDSRNEKIIATALISEIDFSTVAFDANFLEALWK